MISLTQCKICGSSKLPLVRRYTARASLNGDWKHAFERALPRQQTADIGLVLCLRCGFLFYRDVLAPDEMRSLYATENRLERADERAMKPGMRWLLQGILGFLGPHLQGRAIHSAMDIGPGDFTLLEQVRALIPGAAVSALDPCYPHERFRDIQVVRAMLEEYQPTSRFDLVLAMHVLEHVADLRAFMDRLSALVDGLLFVEVPFQVGPALFFNRSVSSQHINYFTPETMRLLLENHGFTIVAEEFSTDAYRRIGMPGVIRMLATKKDVKAERPRGALTTLQHLLNPKLIIRDRLAPRIGL